MIKKFTFRLEQVLRHRANMEEVRERALAEVEERLARERVVLADLLGLRAEVLDGLAALQAAAFDVTQRDQYQGYLGWLATEVDREHRLLGELETLRDAKRAELVRASQDRRIVEKLKDRERGEHQNLVARLDQQALDEVATNAFARGERSWHTSPKDSQT